MDNPTTIKRMITGGKSSCHGTDLVLGEHEGTMWAPTFWLSSCRQGFSRVWLRSRCERFHARLAQLRGRGKRDERQEVRGD